MRILIGFLALTLMAAPSHGWAQNLSAFGTDQAIPGVTHKKASALGDDTAAPSDDPAKKTEKFGPREPFGPPVQHLAIAAAPPDQASDIIGMIVQAEGKAFIKSGGVNGKIIAAPDKTPIHLHDTIISDTGARVLVLIDSSQITLGEKAAMTVDTYEYDPDLTNGNRIRLSIPAGAFKYADGAAEKSRTEIEIVLPLATAKVKDATLWGGPSADGYGIFAISGAVAITTGRGRVMVKQGQGTILRDARAMPDHPAPWAPDRITAALKDTQIADGKDAAAKLTAIKGTLRTLVSRYKAWMIQNAVTKNDGRMRGFTRSH